MTARAALAAAVVLTLLTACRNAAPPDVSTVPASTPAAGAPLFADAFDDDRNGWRASEGEGGAAIVAGVYSWTLPPGDHVLIAMPAVLRDRAEALTRVHVRVDVTVDAVGARVGIVCRARGPGGASELYVLSTRLPEVDAHRITRLDADGRVDLAQTEPVAEELPDLQRSHVLEADCVDDRGVLELALAVDGEQVLSARDRRPLRAGVVGLWAVSPPTDIAPVPTTVDFDDFVVELR